MSEFVAESIVALSHSCVGTSILGKVSFIETCASICCRTSIYAENGMLQIEDTKEESGGVPETKLEFLRFSQKSGRSGPSRIVGEKNQRPSLTLKKKNRSLDLGPVLSKFNLTIFFYHPYSQL